MFFEGSEKKFELVVQGAEFRARPRAFWDAVVELAGAKILSHASTDQIDAYILSESSLFVWDERVIMITCGRTNLARAALRLVEKMDPERVEFLSFERKNESFPHQQETDFYNDVRELQSRLEGKAYRFGWPDEHHLFLYHLDRPFQPAATDATLEVLMYNFSGRAADVFRSGQTLDDVRRLTRIDQFLPGFEIDDHLFEPCGYSLNAIRKDEYYTIHVTPEETGSYVSFETNARLNEGAENLVRALTEVFQPNSFDVVYFDPRRPAPAFRLAPYIERNCVRESLGCGFDIAFSTYYLKSGVPQRATELKVNL